MNPIKSLFFTLNLTFCIRSALITGILPWIHNSTSTPPFCSDQWIACEYCKFLFFVKHFSRSIAIERHVGAVEGQWIYLTVKQLNYYNSTSTEPLGFCERLNITNAAAFNLPMMGGAQDIREITLNGWPILWILLWRHPVTSHLAYMFTLT